MDEFGSRIPHSSTPSCRLVPFLWSGDGLAYSLLFPIEPLEAGSRVTRDFIEGLERGRGEEARKALLLPWIHSDFKEHGSTQGEPSKELPGRRINQFPCENVITIKDFLAVACRRQ